MEDAHAIDLNLDGDEDKSNTFFAVYDGHGGKHCHMQCLTTALIVFT